MFNEQIKDDDDDDDDADVYLHSAAKRPDSRTKLCECSSKTVRRYTMQKR